MSVLVAMGAGASAGLLATVHCAAMCGPLAAAQGVRAGAGATATYTGGRLLSYTVMGALAGASGQALFAAAGPVAGALLSLSFAAALLLVAARLWRAPRAAPPIAIGKRRRPLVARLVSAVRPGPFGFGVLTALLPCGALWAALALAAGTGQATGGALAMLAFAAVSSLGLVAGGWLGGAVRLRRPAARRALAVVLVAGALVAAARPITAGAAGADPDLPPCHRLMGTDR